MNAHLLIVHVPHQHLQVCVCVCIYIHIHIVKNFDRNHKMWHNQKID